MTFITQNAAIAAIHPSDIISMNSSVAAADAASVGSYHIRIFIMNISTNQIVHDKYFYNQPITQTAQAFTEDWANNLPLGNYRYGCWIYNSAYSILSNSQNYVDFSVTPARIPLYGTHNPKITLLRSATNGDPLSGSGFLPNDNKTYQLILSDEFDGSSLDSSKWKTRYIYNNGQLDYLNDELERYVDNHIVSNGTLKFTATPRPGTSGHAPFGSINYPLFDSSMIRSITTFKYGYIEARCKLPYERGVWPAMWLNPQVGWPPEIDIFEFVVTGVTELPNMIHHNVHRSNMPDGNGRYLYADLNVNQTYGYWKAPASLDPNYFGADWHVYGCLWEDGIVTFYIDGEPIAARRCVWKHDDGSDGGMAHFLLNLAIGGSWPTNNWTTPVPTTPQVMETDYIRIYQDANNIITGTSTV